MPADARERHALGTFTAGGRFTTLLDLNPATGEYAPIRDSFKVTPPTGQAIMAKTGRKYGGSQRAAVTHDNGSIAVDLYITGTTNQAAMTRLNTLLGLLESTAAQQLYYCWFPYGADYPVYFEIRDTSWEPMYRWIEFSTTKTLQVRLGLQVAPLALGDPMDIYDDFSENTISDYTFDAGSGTLAVSGGQLVPSTTAAKRLYHSARGYTYTDVQLTLKFTTGATLVSGVHAGLIAKRIDANNYLSAVIEDAGGATYRLRLYKTVAGVSSFFVGGLAPTFSANTPNWLRFRIEGNVITAEHFLSEPTPNAAPSQSISNVLSAAEAAQFGAAIAGQVGLMATPNATDYRYDDFRVEAYAYKDRVLAEAFVLNDIPGTAPAKVDVNTGMYNPGTVQAYALFGWAKRPTNFNMVWNGDFRYGTAGWSVAGNGSIGAATSITRTTTVSKFGNSSARIVSPGGTTGTFWVTYRKFRKGQTYTVAAWVRSDASTATLNSLITGPVTTFGTGVVLSTSWQQVTFTFTATADSDIATLNLYPNAAATWDLDGVQVYEGTAAPTSVLHTEGGGAHPPFGVIEAEADDPTLRSTNLNANTSASRHGGYIVYNNVSAQTVHTQEWWIDPALMAADEFSDEYSFEVYARGFFEPGLGSLNALLQAYPEAFSWPITYTSEWGSSGKTVVVPTGSTNRDIRLGTLVLPTDGRFGRYRMKLTLTTGNSMAAGAGVGLDYLVLVPSRQRASTPTGKTLSNAYPYFHPTGGAFDLQKTIYSDLSGALKVDTRPRGRDAGLGGQLLELAPGDNEFVWHSSSIPPDPPASDATTLLPIKPVASAQFSVQPRHFLARTD